MESDYEEILVRLANAERAAADIANRLRSLETRILELEHETAHMEMGTSVIAPPMLKSLREIVGVIGNEHSSVRDLLDSFRPNERSNNY